MSGRTTVVGDSGSKAGGTYLNGALVNAPTPADDSVGAPAAKKARHSPRIWTLYVLSFLIVLVGWWLAAASQKATELLPPPQDVIAEFGRTLSDGSLLEHIWASLRRVLIGFLLGVGVAVPAGFLMGWYVLARGLVEPWVQFLRTIPPLALIPLVVLFLGIGENAKISLIFLAAFLATVVATYQGVRNVDATLINAARVLGANDRTMFLRVVVPASFPFILTGARIGLGNAWATLVAAELVAANSGLGYSMQVASQYFNVPYIFVGIIMIGVLGFAMDRGLLLLESRLTAWQERRRI